MPIPDFDGAGLLPPGLYDCSQAEVQVRFGTFQNTDRRPELYRKLKEYLEEVRNTQLVCAVIIDGSFVTAQSNPNDVDLILLLFKEHDFSAELRPYQANPLSRRWVIRRYGFDVLLARDESAEYAEYLAFFGQVRNAPATRKGLLKVRL